MFRKLTFLTLLLAFCVVAAGAYVRISDAGLGCPDWPGCYGKLWVEPPQPGSGGAEAGFDAVKAWKEMGHRYLAGALGVLMLVLAGLVFTVRENRGRAIAWTYTGLVLVAGQAALGMWTVRLHVLPPVVTAHLLLGLLTLAGLYRLFLTVGPQSAPVGETTGLRWLGRFGLLALFAQLFLGGWVSSNYAALSCPDFPTCLGEPWPEADYAGGFEILRALEPGYLGALLPPSALVAVHWAHRIGAGVVFVLLSVLAMGVTSNPKVPRLSKAGLLLSFLLLVQVGLGVAAVLLRLPVAVAVAHSVVAALLLLDLVHIQYFLGVPRRAEVPAQRPLPVGQEIPVGELPTEIELPPTLVPPPLVEVPARAPADNLFGKLKSGLGKTRGGLTGFLADLALGKKAIDRDLLDDIEAQLLTADIGVTATRDIVDHLTDSLDRNQLADVRTLTAKLREYLYDILAPVDAPLVIPPETRPYVVLVVGVNGVGKTTTIGKLAKRFQQDGHSVMLAAGDTFRAAAVEQLQTWGERNHVHVVAQHTGADSASVIFDAVQAAQARNIDVLIADTAGRLHTKSNLMDELSKIKRIMRRLDETAPHEVLLVVDSGTGQNAINQARQFNDAVGLTGIALTKLDGTAKGGVIFALAKQFGIPIRYIGVGEGIDDLQDFDAKQFIEALFAE
ncbi:fused signal recognition particle receptor [Methylomagnum ishizawai]|uniref:Signal recognition particle receptor FtsY n=1 Tax=Methylomagnum ishizawai TaxID=1760988 RepID=A0A1Y6CV00_9GAMM|nr:signal recognition particle-docking protein FtsY [Methylomagnum ishizawai]SMF94458.1 fused signal recognition particle receptor [Methylomagnum ishizawai]